MQMNKEIECNKVCTNADFNGKTMQCLLCGEDADLKTSSVKGYQEPELYSIYHCPHCNTSFSMPRVDATAVYQLIYENKDKVRAYDRYWKYAEEIKFQDSPIDYLANAEPSYTALISSLMDVIKPPMDADILEVGSGLGYMTYALRKADYTNAIGIDIAPDAVETATSNFGPFYVCADIYKWEDNNEKKYDVILMTEVIEHIEHPEELVKKLISLLKVGGTLIMTTPNKSFFPNNVIWMTDNPPVHCWWFSEDSFKHLAQKLNMKVSFFDFTKYIKNHSQELIDVNYPSASANFVFDKDNKWIDRTNENVNYGIFPQWVKKWKIYKRLSRLIYPMVSKNFVISKIRTNTLCVLLKK
jgi:2-polyprenyl-3-methyl-5-hydroxy-6-metoxy-1,4-benzoquinol methylase